MAGFDRVAAVRAERAATLEFLERLDDEQWRTPSRAAGWQIRDVVAHLAALAADVFTPRLIGTVTGGALERANEAAVARRADRAPAQLLADYRTWSGRLLGLLTVADRTPVGRVPLRLSELGWYRMRLLPSVFLFDTHVHLRLDVAPVLGLTVPATDGPRMTVLLEWMLAGLSRMNVAEMAFVDRPIGLVLTGPGGGSWRVGPGRGRLTVTAGPAVDAASRITSRSTDFPAWGTRRADWRDLPVKVAGDRDFGARFLDALHIV